MSTREPYLLTPVDLLAAEARLFQADVDLTIRANCTGKIQPSWPFTDVNAPVPGGAPSALPGFAK